MITEADLERLAGLSCQDFLAADPNVAELFRKLFADIGPFSHATISTAIALLLGSLFGEAQILGCESDNTGIVDFDQRMRWLAAIARISYTEIMQQANTLGVYGKHGPS